VLNGPFVAAILAVATRMPVRMKSRVPVLSRTEVEPGDVTVGRSGGVDLVAIERMPHHG